MIWYDVIKCDINIQCTIHIVCNIAYNIVYLICTCNICIWCVRIIILIFSFLLPRFQFFCFCFEMLLFFICNSWAIYMEVLTSYSFSFWTFSTPCSATKMSKSSVNCCLLVFIPLRELIFVGVYSFSWIDACRGGGVPWFTVLGLYLWELPFFMSLFFFIVIVFFFTMLSFEPGCTMRNRLSQKKEKINGEVWYLLFQNSNTITNCLRVICKANNWVN